MSTNKIYAECINGDNSGSSLGTSVGLAPKSCINFAYNYDSANNNLEFTWEDVDCDFWGGVRFVLKKGSEPETFTDGDVILDITEINKYKTEPLKIPVSETGNYYAALFPFSSTWVMNTIRANILNKSIVMAKPFSESTWEEIAAISEAGLASEAYNINDFKSIVVGDYTYNMKIIGFNMFNLSSDPTKTAGICLFANKAYPINTDSCMGSTLRQLPANVQSQISAYMNFMLNLMPTDVTSYIKEIQMKWIYSADSSETITNTKMACLPTTYINNNVSNITCKTADDQKWANFIGCGSYTIENNKYVKYSGIETNSSRADTIYLRSSGNFPVFCFNI